MKRWSKSSRWWVWFVPFVGAVALGSCSDDESGTGPNDDGGPGGMAPQECLGHEGTVFCQDDIALTCSPDGVVVGQQDCDDGMGGYCIPEEGCFVIPEDYSIDLHALYSADRSEETAGIVLVATAGDVTAETFATARFAMRPLTLSETGGWQEGSVLITATGELELFYADGMPLPLPATVGVDELPLELLVSAPSPTDGTITAVFTPPNDAMTSTDVLRVRSVSSPGLAGRPLGGYPYFEFVDSFNDSEVVSAGIDPTRFPDRLGFAYDIYVVPHRTPEEWAVDNSLADASGGAEASTVTGVSIADSQRVVWATNLDPGTNVSAAYDVVFDFGDDGTLDPGDLIDGLYSDRAGLYVVKNLDDPGPYATASVMYQPSFWLAQKTYYPVDIATLGQLPLVVISHGNGHDYTWYDYLGAHLASHGYVVMSHRNETMPGIETASTTTLTNTDYILGNLATIAGGVLDGHVDAQRVAWVGHSRGGEGVVRAYDRLVEGNFVPTNYTAANIVLVSSIAPTVFNSVDVSDPHDVDYHLLAGAADGDVTGQPDCPQCQFFRLAQRATGSVQVTYVQGASHNDFNCCGFDDGTGPALIGRTAAQRVSKSYYLALFDYYLRDNLATRDYLTRPYYSFRPSGIGSNVVVANTYREAIAAGHFFLDDFQSQTSTTVASSGGAVTATVASLVEGKLDDGDSSLGWNGADPMNGMTQAYDSVDQSRGATFSWSADTFYEIEVPAAQTDFTAVRYLSFRACQISRHPNTVALDGSLDFTVTLFDAAGTSSSINIGEYGGINGPYKRTGVGSGAGWANEFVTIRIRLSDFEGDGSGIDLTNIARVRLAFGGENGSDLGALGLDDLELTP
jgi:hypothetical protein